MSPAKRPAPVAVDEPKARVTLNLPASMYRDIERWSIEVAGSLGVPRVSVQDAMRAMIQAAVKDEVVTAVVVDLLRRGRQEDTVALARRQRSTGG